MRFLKLVLGLIITSVVYNTLKLIMSHISIICKGRGFSLANVFHELMAAADAVMTMGVL